ncbi:hypothetical protein EYR40_000354 [Pleurotus pulmonarius]|nr:hypothetical protein EYR38_003614 [Pleurotus pulmonarius]KAF4608013.1 hypothetical protein EYR40_000354 [Pleurotus pulmonarius]
MSKVVFVGNVPYNMAEEQLIDVFKSVGQVVGFRLVFDRDTGKPKGYGFCEFADHETAMSAVRNLNNTDVGGRPLRIDLADSDPFLEGKTTVRGEIVDGGMPGPSENRDPNAFLSGLPTGVAVPPGQTSLDVISNVLANMAPNSLVEVLAQMKAFVINHPDQARTLLVAHPQLAYALFQALVLNNIVDPAILQRMLSATTSGSAAPPPPQAPSTPAVPPHASHMPPPPHLPNFPPQHQPYAAPQMPPASTPRYHPPPPMPVPPPSAMFTHQPPLQQPAPQISPYYRPPPPAPSATPPARAPQVPALPDMDEAQKNMLLQVLSMTQEQINALPPTERNAIQQLRSQLGGGIPT